MNAYKYRVTFDKVFVSGGLKGITYRDKLDFATWNDADMFARRDGLIITPCVGNDAYRQECSILEAI